MRLLDRYLLRELLTPLGFCLGGFVVFWVAFDLFANLADLQKAKMTGADIAEYYFLSAPEMLVIILPVALLLGLLFALTHHAKHHEITAIRAAGVSLWRFAAPYLVVGLLLSVGVFALNELVVPDATARAEELKERRQRPPGEVHDAKVVRNLGFTNARERRKWQIGEFNLDSGEVQQVQVGWALPDGLLSWLFAERGVFTNGSWTFYNVKVVQQTAITNTILAPALVADVLVKREFDETPEQIRSEVKIAGAIGLKRAKRADIPLKDLIDYLRLHPKLTGTDYAWLHTKLHARLATPWTCLVVVLIAIPFGAPSGRRNVFVGVASSIFICFAYFVLQQVGLAFGSGGLLPPWLAAWLPNLFFGLSSIFLIARVR